MAPRARAPARGASPRADIGISGVNLGVAETGTICVVENEGNARLVTALPRIHVAVMGMERVVRDWDEAAHILQILPMAAIGDDAAGYVNLITGPRAPDEADGPEELHLVILDGGRSALRGTDLEEALDCIRCGACLYSCPMWRSVGGQAYGSPYSGPIGAVLTPLLEGMEGERSSRAAVHVVALRRVPRRLPGRHPAARPAGAGARPGDDAGAPARPARASALWSRAWSSPLGLPGRRSALARIGLRLRGRRGWARRLPGPGADWTDQRDLPTRWPPTQPLAERDRSRRWRGAGPRARCVAAAGVAARRPSARADAWGVERALLADDPVLDDARRGRRASAATAARCCAGPTGAAAAGASCSAWRAPS